MKLVSEAVADRLCRRLLDHAQALEALRAEFGIDPETAKRFRVGLADPYPKKTPTSPEPFHQDALVGPVRDERGRFIKRYVYAVLPGITVDGRLQHDRRLRWSVGSALTYYSRATSDTAAAFVCGDVVDLWAVAGLISGTSLEGQLVLIASTQGALGKWPAEWLEATFWSRWKAVYLGTPVRRAATPTDTLRSTDARWKWLGWRSARCCVYHPGRTQLVCKLRRWPVSAGLPQTPY